MICLRSTLVRNLMNKLFRSFTDAIADIPDNATIMMDGFGGPGGMPQQLILALREHGAQKLTIISNTAGLPGFGTIGGDLAITHNVLIENGQVQKVIASFPVSPSPSRPNAFEQLYREGNIELELVPQGTLAERIRSGGAGIPAFYTPTGVGTPVALGKESRFIQGREYILESALTADYAFIRANKADTLGNLVYTGTSRNFNADMAMAAKVTIAEVDEIVEIGDIDAEIVMTPGIFVQRIVKR